MPKSPKRCPACGEYSCRCAKPEADRGRCKACEGSGVSSRGGVCLPCAGSGRKVPPA